MWNHTRLYSRRHWKRKRNFTMLRLKRDRGPQTTISRASGRRPLNQRDCSSVKISIDTRTQFALCRRRRRFRREHSRDFLWKKGKKKKAKKTVQPFTRAGFNASRTTRLPPPPTRQSYSVVSYYIILLYYIEDVTGARRKRRGNLITLRVLPFFFAKN